MNTEPSILVVGPAWVGDMVMAQGLFKTLKAQGPCQIDVLAPEWSRALTDRMPEVRASLTMPVGHGQFKWTTRRALGRGLRGKYQVAYVLPNSWKSALIPWQAQIPRRIGWWGECRWGLLNEGRCLDRALHPKMMARFVALAYAPGQALPMPLPVPQLRVEPQARERALAIHGLQAGRPVLALCPGAEFGPSKRWPALYYAQVAEVALARGWQVWIFGSPKDQAVAAHIQEACQARCQDLTGKTTLAEAIDLLSMSACVLSNDSGLMHIAAALERPLIALYGSTDPEFTPPLSEKALVLRTGIGCSPCFKRECPLGHQACMRELKPVQVLAQLEALW